MRKVRYVGLCILLVAAVGLVISCGGHQLIPQHASLPLIEGATLVGDDVCYGCHSDIGDSFKKNIHGRIAAFETMGVEKGCESCHGAGSIHAESADPADILSFGEEGLNFAQESEMCLQCHTQMYWRVSEHPLNGVSCTECHSIHAPKADNMLAEEQPKGCYECHQDIQMKTTYPSHHPIWEQQRTDRRRMECTDCHDPHGSAVRCLKTDERVNDLCFKCHASLQGPFIFEHEPVVEDCTICHEPHGTVANSLLKQNEPFICLQCHESHFHAGKEGYDASLGDPVNTGTHVYGQHPGAYSASDRMAFKLAWTTKCTQCHFEIHGSDLPSQSVWGQGRGLTR